jgi:putative transcriptional regulator
MFGQKYLVRNFCRPGAGAARLRRNILAPERPSQYMMGMIIAEEAVLIFPLLSPCLRQRIFRGLISRRPPSAPWLMATTRRAGAVLLVFAGLMLAAPSAPAAQKQPDQPLFLVARSDLNDPYFWHSVILMLPFPPDPLVVGIIVNRPTRIALHDLFPQDQSLQGNTGNAFFGGPVSVRESSIVFRAAKAPPNSVHLSGHLYLSSDASLTEKLLKDPDQRRTARLFLGRAQWAPLQLQREVLEGSWYRLRAEGTVIFNPDPQSVWRTMLARARPGSVARYRYPGGGKPRSVLLLTPAAQPSW